MSDAPAGAPSVETKAPEAPAPSSLLAGVKAPEAAPKQPEAPVSPEGVKPADGKAPDVKPGEGKADQKGEEKLEVKIPEGFNSDTKSLEGFTSLAKELGLKSDGAQKLLDLFVANRQEAAKQESDQLSQQITKWEAEIKAKPGYEAELGLAKKALVNLTKGLSPELAADTQNLFEGTWIGSHPGVLAVLAAAGKLVGEDQFIEGGNGARPSGLDGFYSKSKMK